MKKIHIQGAFISAAIALLTGFLSSILSGNQGYIYSTINLPPFAPPAWLFGIVWPILYILMGIAAYIIYASFVNPKDKWMALICYGIQLLINFSWSIVFFRFEAFGLAVLVLALLLLFLTLTIMFFYKINKVAAFLLMPYYLWLLLAYYLNIGVFVLNLA